MADDDDDLRSVFNFVRLNEWATAKQIGSVVAGGESRASQILKQYHDTLFVMRVATPIQWKVVSADALQQVLPPEINSWRNFESKASRYRPSISTCGACGRPIQPSGKCGCT